MHIKPFVEGGMTWEEYKPLAMRTAKKLGHEGDIIHAMMGCVCEALEYLNAHHVAEEAEEVGDFLWFRCLLDESIGKKVGLSSSYEYDTMEDYDQWTLEEMVEVIASAAKGWFAYGKKYIPLFAIRELSTSMAAYIVDSKTGIDVLADNINKLKERYPDKYSDWHARERLDKK